MSRCGSRGAGYLRGLVWPRSFWELPDRFKCATADDKPVAKEERSESKDDVEAVKSIGKVLKQAAESKQQMLKLPVRIVDPDGKPVAKAKVFPWALRSSQGHGWWPKDDKESDVGPQEVVTDDDGKATVLYPKYRHLNEQIKTLEVTLRVDQPDFAYLDAEFIEVPLETKGPYEVKLKPAVRLTVQPLLDGKPAPLDNLFVMWSDGPCVAAGIGTGKNGGWQAAISRNRSRQK